MDSNISSLYYNSSIRYNDKGYADEFKPTKVKTVRSSEAGEQRVVVSWCQMKENRYPQLKLLYHIPNGGKRSKSEAVRFKSEGVKSGVPDLCLPVKSADGCFNSLYIEMKYGVNTTSDKQKEWLNNLNKQGSYACVCYDADCAITVIEKYLGIQR